MLKLTKGSNETFKVSATEASGASKAGVTACLGASMRECHQAFKAAQTSNDASAQKPEEIHGTKLLAAGGIRVALSSAKFIREGDEKVPNNHSEKMSDRQLSETESSDEQSKGNKIPGIKTKSLANVPRESVHWLWKPRVPRGEITIIQGDPGKGKTWFACEIIAALTGGRCLPEMTKPLDPIKALVFCEDGAGTVLRPRLEDMGATLSRIDVYDQFVTGHGTEAKFDLSKLDALEDCVARLRPDLILFDPYASFAGSANSIKPEEVRSLLDPISALAKRHDLAVLVNMHLNKSQGSRALQRVSGSMQFPGTARSVLYVERNTDDATKRIVLHLKCNLAPEAPSISFTVAEKIVTKGTIIKLDPVPVVQWLPDKTGRWYESDFDNPKAKASKSREAKAMLKGLLRIGPVPLTELNDLAKELKLPKRTVERARADLGVEPINIPGSGGAMARAIRLPKAQPANPIKQESLDILIAQKVTEKIGEELKKMWRSGGVADSTPPDRQIAGKEAQSRPESSVESCAGEGRFLEYLCTIPGT
jgi:hypothetical protein